MLCAVSIYIDDPDYMNFACIITEITDGSVNNSVDIPGGLANFAATELEIRITSIRNAIASERIVLKNYQKIYAEYYKYYQDLMSKVTVPRVQNAIRIAREEAQKRAVREVKERKRNLENSFVPRLNEYKRYLINIILSLVGLAVIFFVIWYFSKSTVIGILALSTAGLQSVEKPVGVKNRDICAPAK